MTDGQATTRSESNSGLLQEAILAHGGKALSTFGILTATLEFGGTAWDALCGPGLISGSVFELRIREGSVVIAPFVSSEMRSLFKANAVTLENQNTGVVETRYNPTFAYETLDVQRWDSFQTAYICSYSIRSVIGAPFVFAMPGFEVEEGDAVELEGRRHRKLLVTFPRQSGFHPGQQINYVDDDGLIRRQDYNIDNLGKIPVICIPSDYRDIQGVKLPMSRRIYNFRDDLDLAVHSPMYSTDVTHAEFV